MKQKLLITIAVLLSSLFVFSACSSEKTVNVSAKVTVEQSSKKNNELSTELLKNTFFAKLDVNSDGLYYVVLETLEKKDDQLQTQTVGFSEMKNGKESFRFAFMPEIVVGENNTQSLIGKWMMDAPTSRSQDHFQTLNFLHQLPSDVTNSTNQPTNYFPILQEENTTTTLKMNDSLLLYYVSYQSPGPFDQTLTSISDIQDSSASYIYAVVLRITDEAPSLSPSTAATIISEASSVPTEESTTVAPSTPKTSAPIKPTNSPKTTTTTKPTSRPTSPAKTLTPTVERQQESETTVKPTTSDANPTITPDQGVFTTSQPLLPAN